MQHDLKIAAIIIMAVAFAIGTVVGACSVNSQRNLFQLLKLNILLAFLVPLICYPFDAYFVACMWPMSALTFQWGFFFGVLWASGYFSL